MYTITEALAELKTSGKRIAKKQEFILSLTTRVAALRDPVERSGGSDRIIAQEMQSIEDLRKRHLAIRMAIQKSNQETQITIQGTTRSVAEWLTWRKEIYPEIESQIRSLTQKIQRDRQQTSKITGSQVNIVSADAADSKPTDLIVNLDEKALADWSESLTSMYETLDGQLSLRNATVMIDVP